MPVYRGQPITGFSFKLRNPQTGGDVNSGSVTGYYLLDGGIQGTIAGTPVPEGHGRWSVNLLGSEVDGAQVGLDFEDSASGASASFTIFTEPVPSSSSVTGVPVLPIPIPGQVQVYCTDEDVAIRSPGDFSVLCPEHQTLATGTDGVLTTGTSGTSWNFASASNDFVAQGVLSGCVLELQKTRGSGVVSGMDAMLAVDSIAGPHDLRIRRIGAPAGRNPGPLSPTTSGLTFLVATLYPQIENAAYEINQRYGIDAKIPYRDPGSAYDLRQLRQLNVAMVLENQYEAMSREGDDKDEFARKWKHWGNIREKLESGVSLRWGQSGEDQAPTWRFGARTSR
jgi:hypothetical protein